LPEKGIVMAKKKEETQDEPLVIKKGFNYYCSDCNEFYRWAKLVPKTLKLYQIMTCPECGEMVTDYKRK
jgi:predicted SprT family Zn-dependent metalloprotease